MRTKRRVRATCAIELLFSAVCLGAALAEPHARLSYYLPADSAPPGSREVAEIRLAAGAGVVRVRRPELFAVTADDVVSVELHTLPLTVDAELSNRNPTAGSLPTNLYRVVLKVKPVLRRAISDKLAAICGSGVDLQLVFEDRVVDHLVVNECGPYEPRVLNQVPSALSRAALRSRLSEQLRERRSLLPRRL